MVIGLPFRRIFFSFPLLCSRSAAGKRGNFVFYGWFGLSSGIAALVHPLLSGSLGKAFELTSLEWWWVQMDGMGRFGDEVCVFSSGRLFALESPFFPYPPHAVHRLPFGCHRAMITFFVPSAAIFFKFDDRKNGGCRIFPARFLFDLSLPLSI